jgi:LysR family transcriptional regulator, cell division regulator
MDAGDLRVFEAVARLGGMNRAAHELNTVQSNVTSRIRLLEKEVGVPLFKRHSRGVALTNAGERLLPYAMKVAGLLTDAKRAVKDDGRPKGPLRIGSLETTAAYRLPPLISRYGASYPAVDLSLKTATNLGLIEDVLNHELDGAFVCGPLDHPDLNQTVVFHEELVIATAVGRKKFSSTVDNGALKILVKGQGCAYRERLEDMLARRNINISRIEFGTLDAIVGCVAAGLGETLLPQSVLAPAVKDKRVEIHRLPPAESKVETLFVTRRDAFVSSALAAFLEIALSANRLAQAAE